MTDSYIRNELMEYMKNKPIINTHSHHLDEKAMLQFDLDKLIANTYLQWLGIKPGCSYESRKIFLDKVRYKSYFVWLQKSIQELYGIQNTIIPEQWDCISEKIREAYSNPSFYMDVLENKCCYQKIIAETYWNPGYDNGRPEIFRPSFRIDSFLYGYKKGICDHDGVSPEKYGELPDNLTDYVDWVKKWIFQKKQDGCIALKSAIAYERNINFEDVSKEKAKQVFTLKEDQINTENIVDFQNYMFYRICEMAAECSLPLQCHTGTGQLIGTRVLELNSVIRKNPDTQFVLLHCGYPWVDDIFAMLDEYQNVYPDLSWLPILSYTEAERVIHELIETSMVDKICWGCDTWTAEESYGALLAFRFALASALEKKINDGYLSFSDAIAIIDNFYLKNASKLYGI